MTVLSLVAVAEPHTGKINKNGLSVFERGENLPQNCILHRQKSHCKVEFTQTKN